FKDGLFDLVITSVGRVVGQHIEDYNDEKELGRIVETPNDSLEKDILKILTGDKDADKNKKE
ncbi:MAG: hypothetical protein P8Y81_05140, partial [Ignavibacteriaceae bacterium]